LHQKEKKAKVAIFIDQTIHFVAEHKGRPIPPNSQPLRGYPFHEMRIKDSSNLIRIMYFCYHQKILVLLHSFEKPDYYEKSKKRKVEKEMHIALEQAHNNYKDFIKNQYYEAY
jgi:phage-related protein